MSRQVSSKSECMFFLCYKSEKCRTTYLKIYKKKNHQLSALIKSLANTQEFLIIYPNFYLHLTASDEKPILVHLPSAVKAQGIQQFKLRCDCWCPRITQSRHTEDTGNTDPWNLFGHICHAVPKRSQYISHEASQLVKANDFIFKNSVAYSPLLSYTSYLTNLKLTALLHAEPFIHPFSTYHPTPVTATFYQVGWAETRRGHPT